MMGSAFRLIEPPLTPPALVDEVKAFLRLDSDEELALLSSLAEAAIILVETHCRRALMRQRFQLSLPRWPDGAVPLPRPPLLTVEEVAVAQEPGTFTPVNDTLYMVDTVAEPGLIIPTDHLWPQPAAGIRITYASGYGEDWTLVPQPLRQAVVATAVHWFDQRQGSGDLAPGAAALIAGYRIFEL